MKNYYELYKSYKEAYWYGFFTGVIVTTVIISSSIVYLTIEYSSN
jgi:hypothetical protein